MTINPYYSFWPGESGSSWYGWSAIERRMLARNSLDRRIGDRWRRRRICRSGAPRQMKKGNTASPWRYDVEPCRALQPANPRQAAISRAAQLRTHQGAANGDVLSLAWLRTLHPLRSRHSTTL